MNPIRARAKRRVRVYQETSGRHSKKVNVVAGYLNGIILALSIYGWSTDREWFCLWYEHTLIPLLKPGSVIVLDNATFHSRTFLPVIAEAYGHKILWLPKYSPHKICVYLIRLRPALLTMLLWKLSTPFLKKKKAILVLT